MKTKKIRVGILGATGFVGQRFVSLLTNHPWFEITALAASPQSAGKKYIDCVKNRWHMPDKPTKYISKVAVDDVADIKNISKKCDFVFSALNMEKEAIKKLESAYADAEIPVVSNNSAHRWSDDVPMIIPEVNPDHVKLLDYQKKVHRRQKGFIVAKPNCSIQSYVAVLHAWKKYGPYEAVVTSMQAISGAGKTFAMWPEMVDNLIPFIGGEEEKSEKEPLKIWGELKNGKIKIFSKIKITATCVRVPVSDGHMAAVRIKFRKKATLPQLIKAVENFDNPLTKLNLPSAPSPFLKYLKEENRPQTKLDRMTASGMGITIGRIEPDSIYDYKFIALSHNTIRGAAGGAILVAELLHSKGYL